MDTLASIAPHAAIDLPKPLHNKPTAEQGGKNMLKMLAVSLVAGLLGTAASSQVAADPFAKVKTNMAIGGAVNANGTLQGAPKTFTVTHQGPGKYLIQFSVPFSVAPICVFSAVSSTPVTVAGVSESSTSCSVQFYSPSSQAAVDVLFNFVAAGLQ